MIGVKIIGIEKLVKSLGSQTIKDPLAKGIKAVTKQMERLTKQATVVNTGRLRSSIASQIAPDKGIVGTNVNYAPFIEYGTPKFEARHMEGSSKVLGIGMFTYALDLLRKWLDEKAGDIAKDIEVKFGD